MANAYTCSQMKETDHSINIKKHGAWMNKAHVESSFFDRQLRLFICLFLYLIMY